MRVRGIRSIVEGTATVAAAVLVAAAAREASFVRHPERPPPAFTGGFSEPSCHACHFDSDVNTVGGMLTISGVPEAYRPGETYRLTVRVAKPEMVVGGFELAARFADGASKGKQAGALRAVDGRAQIDSISGIQYAGHTKLGIRPASPAAAEWAIDWTAAADAAGPIVFHAAGNAGNGDESQFGDFVYTASQVSRPP